MMTVTSSNSKNPIEWIKELSGLSLIVAIGYYAGYLAWVSHYRLLGVECEGQPLDYFKTGADFFISTLVGCIRLLADKPSATLTLLFESDLRIISIILILSYVLILVFQYFKTTEKWFYLPMFLLLIAATLLTKQQSNGFNADKLLQIPPHRIYMNYDRKNVPACERNEAIYKRYMQALEEESPRKYALVNQYFNMLSKEDTAHQRLNHYVSIVLLSLFLGWISYLLYIRLPFNLFLGFTMVICLCCVLLLPATYGIFGKNFMYPYTTLKIKKDEKEITTQAVYLIRQNPDNYIVYDYLNFFQIKYLPKEHVKMVNQLFKASPFDNKIQNQFSVCDSLISIPQNRKIIDF